jgi:hypothetical protein
LHRHHQNNRQVALLPIFVVLLISGDHDFVENSQTQKEIKTRIGPCQLAIFLGCLYRRLAFVDPTGFVV